MPMRFKILRGINIGHFILFVVHYTFFYAPNQGLMYQYLKTNEYSVKDLYPSEKEILMNLYALLPG